MGKRNWSQVLVLILGGGAVVARREKAGEGRLAKKEMVREMRGVRRDIIKLFGT